MKNLSQMENRKNVCVGSGLVALDIVISGSPRGDARFMAGGSCGNVLTILSYFGWSSYPIARLSNNVAADLLCRDLVEWGVKTDLLSLDEDGSTPIIIHRIMTSKDGHPKHRFEFRNPEDGKYLPTYKPVLAKSVPKLLSNLPNCDVFFFDRIARSTIDLAHACKKQGTVVFFEPSSTKDLRGFTESVHLADVIKFSDERIDNYEDLFPIAIAPLEIQTRGKDGLRFRLKGETSWEVVPGFRIENLVDTAGAGDWCTAGIILNLFARQEKEVIRFERSDVIKALRFGQVLGSINCIFEGARGLMYNFDSDELINYTSNILDRQFELIEVDQHGSWARESKSLQMRISSLVEPVFPG